MKATVLLALLLVGCQTTPPPAADTNDGLLAICEHAIYAEANRIVTLNPNSRADLEDKIAVLDYMLDEPVKRQVLCDSMGPMDMIAPEGGNVKITSKDIFINQRSISDVFLDDVANALWVGLNKFLYPVHMPPPLVE